MTEVNQRGKVEAGCPRNSGQWLIRMNSYLITITATKMRDEECKFTCKLTLNYSEINNLFDVDGSLGRNNSCGCGCLRILTVAELLLEETAS